MIVSLLLIRFEIKDSEPLVQLGLSDDEIMSKSVQDDKDGDGPWETKKSRGRRRFTKFTVETMSAVPASSQTECSCKKEDSSDTRTVPFVSGNPFVEKTEGILHIYKQNTDAGTAVSSSRILCILNVPAFMTSHNLLQFVAPFSSSISHIRIIRNGRPNEYMVLLYFRDVASAEEFYRNVNGTQFNSIESDICHLVFVSKVEVMKESEGANWPVTGCTELPTCSVCLERMDESVDEILTILCNHSFHGSCLSQWSDTTCPVCRYEQTPEATADPSCEACGRKQDLWICLICGNIGCGRYADGHAEQHFQETQHTFSLEVGGQRVWDYAGDNYVHRLVQSKTDGKVVEYLHPQQTADDLEHAEKIEAVTLEYSYLLTNQLESQRLFFEDKLAMAQQLANNEIEKVKHELDVVHEENISLLNVVQKEKNERQVLEKKLAALHAKLRKSAEELREEREINQCLRDNQKGYADQIVQLEAQLKKITEEKEKEIVELKEELRDLMIHIEAEAELRKNTTSAELEEIQQGQINVQPSPEENELDDVQW